MGGTYRVYPMADWITTQSELNPDRLAVANGTTRYTFHSLNRRIATIARNLRSRGINYADRVAFWLEPHPDTVSLILACLRIGAVIVPLNLRLTDLELAPVLKDASPTLIVGPGSDETMCPVDDILPIDLLTDSTGHADPSMDLLHPNQLAALIYTSGTTGRPKGVELTVSNVWASAMAAAAHTGTMAYDRWLLAVPLFHTSGLSIIWRSALLGHGVIIHGTPFDPSRAIEQMINEQVTMVSLVPTMLHKFLRQKAVPPATLRLALVGGAGTSPQLLANASAQNWPVAPTYGLTETASQIATLRPDQLEGHPVVAGHAIPPTQIIIKNQEGGVEPPDHLGEIWVKGPTIARGYWKNPQETEHTFVEGWLKTGDVGQMDVNGYLKVLGRVKELIITGGENVFPLEVEEALLKTNFFSEVAVFGISDPVWGERVAAALVSDQTVSPTEINRSLRNLLAGYKIPREYYAVPRIPRTASGKTQRYMLAQICQSEGQRIVDKESYDDV